VQAREGKGEGVQAWEGKEREGMLAWEGKEREGVEGGNRRRYR
jgi:hypothetical protein